jgi:hypothetical protein
LPNQWAKRVEVGVYRDGSTLPGQVAYGILKRFRNEAPEWMRAKLTMIDMAAGVENDNYCPETRLPGVGYRGNSWYAVYDDPKYAQEAGIDVSDIVVFHSPN